MTEHTPLWTYAELKGVLERGVIADLEKLIAEPGRKYRQESAKDTTMNALRTIGGQHIET
ncbi:MAG: hypothetical protein ABI465_17590 [Ktedonobacteraceae bacterium]